MVLLSAWIFRSVPRKKGFNPEHRWAVSIVIFISHFVHFRTAEYGLKLSINDQRFKILLYTSPQVDIDRAYN